MSKTANANRDDAMLARLAFQPEQQAAAASPLKPTGLLVPKHSFGPAADEPAGSGGEPTSGQSEITAGPTGRLFIGRPYLLWKDNLELARLVNERLAANP